jgi:hypothetical protein
MTHIYQAQLQSGSIAQLRICTIFLDIYIYRIYIYIYIYVCMHIYIYVVNLIMGCPIDMNQPCQVRFIAEGKSSHCWVAPIYEELRCSNSC